MSECNKIDWKRNEFEDPLGFTKQTAIMLVGLGASDLIPEFKKRNISSRNLSELSKNDLMVLGANENLAEEMLRELSSTARKFSARNMPDEQRMTDAIKVLIGGNLQLNLIETFIAYVRLRLAEKPNDFVIESRKNIRASQALCAAAIYTVKELEQLERNWKQLSYELTDNNERRGKKSCFLELIMGVGLIGSLAFVLKCATVSATT